MPNASEMYTKSLKRILSSPTVLAVALDPEKATVEIMIRNGEREERRTVPLKAEHKEYFKTLQNLVEVYL